MTVEGGLPPVKGREAGTAHLQPEIEEILDM